MKIAVTQAQLQSNIHYCSNQISESSSRIKNLEKKLEDYYEGLKKHNSSKQSFDDFMHAQQTSANKVSGAASDFKFMQGYSNSMRDLLTGNRRRKAEDSFYEMETKIKSAIANTEQEIAAEKRNLYNLNNKLDSLQYELRKLMMNS